MPDVIVIDGTSPPVVVEIAVPEVIETEVTTHVVVEVETPTVVVVESVTQEVVEVSEDHIVVVEEEIHTTITEGIQGPPGIRGQQGDKGERGDPGLAGVSYVHAQATPALEWVIVHNLGRYPSITVVDSAGTTVEGKEDYVSANEIRLQFAAAFAGNAYLN